MKEQSRFIRLVGVKTHNLKNISADFPLGKLTVVTGVSGSGKSSLVFDSLYAESYRRYVDSLSSFARQYLQSLPKPEIESVQNLPASIAVKQSRSGATSRSTVGTLTEIYDFLRSLFGAHALVKCFSCQMPVTAHSVETIFETLLKSHRSKQLSVLAGLGHFSKMDSKTLHSMLAGQGFSRVWSREKEVEKLTDLKKIDPQKHFVQISRLPVQATRMSDWSDSLRLALKLGRKTVHFLPDEEEGLFHLSQNFECESCGIAFEKPSELLFSFNHPLGACKTCQGFGFEALVDYTKAIPDQNSSLKEQGVSCFNFGSSVVCYKDALKHGKKLGITTDLPFAKYTEKQMDFLLHGTEGFYGVDGYLKWVESQKHKAHYRIHAARYRRYEICSECHGARLSKIALACQLSGLSIAEAAGLDMRKLQAYLNDFSQTHRESISSQTSELIQVILARVDYLLRMGLGYLTSTRLSRTLSGGELQRIHMARCLGSQLTDTLYCLDEPSVGLHPRDSVNLVGILKEIVAQGNTAVVVEHEREVIRAADHTIEIGPEAGSRGGRVIYSGPASLASKNVVSGTVPRQLAVGGAKTQNVTKVSTAKKSNDVLILTGAKTHNLKSVDIEIKMGRFNAVCGVSGSGKTSLISHTLYPALAQKLGQKLESAVSPLFKEIGPKSVLANISQVVHVSQLPLGRSSRSNIPTYLGFFDEIRKLLAATSQAVAAGLTPSHFSFNSKGGRCEDCKGLGVISEDLSFLGEMDVVCPSCNGKRFEDRVLAVEYRGKNLSDILTMTVQDCFEFFGESVSLRRKLEPVIEMGLGYITLGQNTSSFSGGEAQRLKLLRLLSENKNLGASLLIFDEPSTGLADKDVANLITQLRLLVEKGHTLVVVEHHVDILAEADHLIEIGPEASEQGGELVYQGDPKGIKSAKNSRTAPFILKALEN